MTPVDHPVLLDSLQRLERDARRLHLRLLQLQHTTTLLSEKVQELAEAMPERAYPPRAD